MSSIVGKVLKSVAPLSSAIGFARCGNEAFVAGIAIITEACIDVKDRALRRRLSGPMHLRVRPDDEHAALRGRSRQR